MKGNGAAQSAEVALVSLCEVVWTTALAAPQRDDDEASHDFRVALRRLRVLLKQLAKPDVYRNKALHSVKALIGVTAQRRDAQVMLAWLAAVWPQLSEQERIGARQWRRTMERLRDRHPFTRKKVTAPLRGLERLLGKLSPIGGSQLTLDMLIAQRLEKQAGKLTLLMRKPGEGQLHLIRLRAKTVRYLLAPLCDELPDCACAQEALRCLQARLGDWHDATLRQQSLRDILRQKVVKASGNLNAAWPCLAAHSPALPGLIALAKLNNQALQHSFDLVQHQDLHDHGMHLAELLQQAISSIRAITIDD